MDSTELNALLDQWVTEKREEYLEDVRRLVRIRSVFGPPALGKPFGEGCWQALQEALSLSEHYGFPTKNYDNFCGSARYGADDSANSIGIFGHLDVVPEGEGWSSDPYEPVIRDGNYIFGRGTADNKAPTLVALYAMRFLKENRIPLQHPVFLVYGCDEERGMHDIPEFLKREKEPLFSLVPDAKYPLGHAEKGILEFRLRSEPLDFPALLEAAGGQATNSVPNNARAVVEGLGLQEAQERLVGLQRIEVRPHSRGVELLASGDQRHATRPYGAVNAIERLLAALLQLGILTGKAREAVEYFHQITREYEGDIFGIRCSDGISTDLTCVGSVLRLEKGRLVLSVNVRYPVLADNQWILETLQKAVQGKPAAIENLTDNPPLYIPVDHPVVQRLLEISSAMLHRSDLKPLVLEGGSYARKLTRAVSYGVTIPDRIRLFGMEKGGAHQVDEYGIIDHLLLNIKIYAVTLMELDKIL